jgi:hypothetical protein
VAIKVIQHDTTNMAALQREANLLVSLNTPNVVQALHYATYINTNENSNLGPADFNKQAAGQTDAAVHFVPMFGDQSCVSAAGSDGPAESPTQQQLVPLPSLDVYVAAAAATAAADAAATSEPAVHFNPPEAVHEAPAVQEAVQQQTVQHQAVQQAETHLVLEWCDAGSLAAVAAEGWLREPEQRDNHMLERLVMLKDVAVGLQELHNQDTVHSNLVSWLKGFCKPGFWTQLPTLLLLLLLLWLHMPLHVCQVPATSLLAAALTHPAAWQQNSTMLLLPLLLLHCRVPITSLSAATPKRPLGWWQSWVLAASAGQHASSSCASLLAACHTNLQVGRNSGSTCAALAPKAKFARITLLETCMILQQ